MKKRIIALLMVAVMLFALVGCADTSAGDQSNSNSSNSSSSNSSSSSSNSSSTGSSEASNTGAVDGGHGASGAQAEEGVIQYEMPEVIQNPVGGSIAIPQTSTMDGNFEQDQYGGGSDNYSYSMIHAYHLAVTNRDGQLIINPMVVREMETTKNEDGSKTYTITLWDDLYFNDGTQITAKNFIAYPILFSSPIGIASGAYGTAGKYFEGYDEFKTGESKVFKGVRLLDTLKFSYTVSAENTPFYYELNMLNCSQYSKSYPLDWETWCPGFDIVDDGEGCYVVGDGWYDSTNTTLASQISKVRYDWENVRTDGPYYLAKVDLGTQITELAINPYYKGNYAGYKPSIEKITITLANAATQIDSLKNGEIDLIQGLNTGTQIDQALDLISTDSRFSEVHYLALQYGKIFFRCDWGPQQFVKVRQAISYLIDKDALINTLFNGHGQAVCGPISKSYWMYQENEEEILERTNAYNFNPEKAIELLVEDGWVLDENGDPYTSGIRWKEVTALEYNPWGEGEYDFGNSKGDPDKRCKQLDDGRVIMPLVLTWASIDGLEMCEVLDVLLIQSDSSKNAGFEFIRTPMASSQLFNYLNSSLDEYFYPSYSMYSSTTGLKSIFDQTYRYSTDPDYLRSNKNRIFDEELDQHTNGMLIGMEPTDDEGFCREWIEHLVRFNEILPEIALYNCDNYTIYNNKIKNYNANPHYTFSLAIIEAYIG